MRPELFLAAVSTSKLLAAGARRAAYGKFNRYNRNVERHFLSTMNIVLSTCGFEPINDVKDCAVRIEFIVVDRSV
jgi:hypothetical protein